MDLPDPDGPMIALLLPGVRVRSMVSSAISCSPSIVVDVPELLAAHWLCVHSSASRSRAGDGRVQHGRGGDQAGENHQDDERGGERDQRDSGKLVTQDDWGGVGELGDDRQCEAGGEGSGRQPQDDGGAEEHHLLDHRAAIQRAAGYTDHPQGGGLVGASPGAGGDCDGGAADCDYRADDRARQQQEQRQRGRLPAQLDDA